MAQYRLLADLWLPCGTLLPAGAIVSDVPPSGQLPPGFVPSAYMARSTETVPASSSPPDLSSRRSGQPWSSQRKPTGSWTQTPLLAIPTISYILVGLGARSMAQLLGKRLG